MEFVLTREVWPMENKAVFLESTEEIAVSQTATPEFYRLYQQSVLLALKEQGVLNEVQVQHCLNTLNHSI